MGINSATIVIQQVGYEHSLKDENETYFLIYSNIPFFLSSITCFLLTFFLLLQVPPTVLLK